MIISVAKFDSRPIDGDTFVIMWRKQMEAMKRPRLGWIEEACMRLLNNAGGVIEDWPELKLKLSEEQQKRDSRKSGGGLLEEGRAPSIAELEEAWFSLENKGYVKLEYDRLNLKRISEREIVPEDAEDEVVYDSGRNTINLVCDILSCVLILPGTFVNNVFGPFPLAFALAITGSRRKWGVLRVIGTVFGSVLAFAFLYNAVR
jgi:hypothetical protein